jgi:hypothetical protein
VLVANAVHFEFDFLAHLAIKQRLCNRGKIADEALFRLGIPGAENSEMLGLLGGQVRRMDNGANANDIGSGIDKIGATSAD